MAGKMNRPHVGDYVGVRISDGEYVYVTGVDYSARTVQIGPINDGRGPWLDETQAMAQYSYQWGQQTALPWMGGYKYTDEHIPTERLGVPTAAPQRCECGSGSNEASGAHSHWCPRWVRP